jgi:hypothetical protein
MMMSLIHGHHWTAQVPPLLCLSYLIGHLKLKQFQPIKRMYACPFLLTFQDVLGLLLDDEFIVTRLSDTFIHVKFGAKNFGFNFNDDFFALEFYATLENCLEILRMNHKGNKRSSIYNCLRYKFGRSPTRLRWFVEF